MNTQTSEKEIFVTEDVLIQDVLDQSPITAKIAAGGKKTIDHISGFLSKKKSPSAPAQSDDIFETIKKLSDLKERGIITSEEFESKKADLLAKLQHLHPPIVQPHRPAGKHPLQDHRPGDWEDLTAVRQRS